MTTTEGLTFEEAVIDMPDATLATLYLIFRKVRKLSIIEVNWPEYRFIVSFMKKDETVADIAEDESRPHRSFAGDDLEKLIHQVWEEVNK